MEKVWTAPVKWSVALAALCVIGTAVCGAIGWSSLSIARQQLDLMQQQKTQLTVTSPGVGPVTISYTPFVISSILAGISILMLIGSVAYIARHAKQPRTVFKILSASWGNSHRREPIEDALRAMRPNALAFFLNPDAFRPYTTEEKADPAPGPDKYLEVTYTSGPYSGTIRRDHSEWVILPDDPVLHGKLDAALTRYNDEQQAHQKTRTELRDVTTARDKAIDALGKMASERNAAFDREVALKTERDTALKQAEDLLKQIRAKEDLIMNLTNDLAAPKGSVIGSKRALSVNQLEALVTMLSRVPEANRAFITVMAQQKDVEAWDYAAEIAHVFNKAGWPVQSIVPSDKDLGLGLLFLGENGRWDFLSDQAGNAIELAFRRVEIPIRLGNGGSIGPGQIQLQVGRNA